jgi:hypothetical protein
MQPNAEQLKEIAAVVEDRAIKPLYYLPLEDGIDAYLNIWLQAKQKRKVINFFR